LTGELKSMYIVVTLNNLFPAFFKKYENKFIHLYLFSPKKTRRFCRLHFVNDTFDKNKNSNTTGYTNLRPEN